MARKVGRPKGSGGKQPGWQFTRRRKQNLKKARKVNAQMRKKAGVGILTSENIGKYKRFKKNKEA